MQATITYLLTEQAQRAKIMETGQPVSRKQTITVDITSQDLELLPVSEDGQVILDISNFSTPKARILNAAGWTPWNGGTGTSSNVFQPPIFEDLRRGVAVLAEQEEELRLNGEHNQKITDAAYQRFMADPSLRIKGGTYRQMIQSELKSPADWWPESHKEFIAEAARRNDADIAAKRLEEEAKEKAKTDLIECWIIQYGKPDIRQQWQDGILCRKTAVSLIAESVLAPIGKALEDPTTCTNRECPCRYLEHTDCIPRRNYPAWKLIKANLPAASTFEFSTYRECLRDEDGYFSGDREESAGPVRYAVTVKVPHGPFTFERTMAL